MATAPLTKSQIREFVRRLQSLPGWEPFHLADVGASAGLWHRLEAFGDELHAVGFDPLVPEMARLRELERRPHVEYEATRVGWREAPDRSGSGGIQPYLRSTAAQVNANYVQTYFNAGAQLEYSDRLVTLDEFYADRHPPQFLKVDTDGWDYDVLRGAERTLSHALGVSIEAQFHGSLHPDANVFSHIDEFLRQRGFQLFSLPVYCYSRAALPAPFLMDLPAQTQWGQAGFSDAVYLRDLGAPEYPNLFSFEITRPRLLLLCALFVLHDLPDCAAEILVGNPMLREMPQQRSLLDALSPTGDYEAYVAEFRRDYTAWYPSRISAAQHVQAAPSPVAETAPVQQTSPGMPELPTMTSAAGLATNEEAQTATALRERVRQLEATNEQLRARVATLKIRMRTLRGKYDKARKALVDVAESSGRA